MVWYFLNGKPVFDGAISITGPYQAGNGTAVAPSYSFTSDSGTGLFWSSAGVMAYAASNASRLTLSPSGLRFLSSATLDWSSGNPEAGPTDLSLSRVAAGSLSVTPGTANGQVFGLINMLTELTTIAAAATTDTTIQMPAGAVILAVSTRVTVTIPTAATMTVGDSGSAARFNTGASIAVSAGTTDPGTKAGAYYNASALSIRFTPNATPAANTGRVRTTIYYYTVTPPSS